MPSGIARLVQRLGVSALKSRGVNKTLLKQQSQRRAYVEDLRTKRATTIAEAKAKAAAERAAQAAELDRLANAPSVRIMEKRARLNELDDALQGEVSDLRTVATEGRQNTRAFYTQFENDFWREHRIAENAFKRRWGQDPNTVLDRSTPGYAEAAALRKERNRLQGIYRSNVKSLGKKLKDGEIQIHEDAFERVNRLKESRRREEAGLDLEELVDDQIVQGFRSKRDAILADKGPNAASLPEVKALDKRIAEREKRLKMVGELEAKKAAGRRAKINWGLGVAGAGTVIGTEVIQGYQDRREAGSPQRLSDMLRAAENQKLQAAALQAAQRRILEGSRQNLIQLAARQPRLYNEIEAGRRLAPGVVSIGGNPQDKAARLSTAATMMATGDMSRMAGPDPLVTLQGILGQ